MSNRVLEEIEASEDLGLARRARRHREEANMAQSDKDNKDSDDEAHENNPYERIDELERKLAEETQSNRELQRKVASLELAQERLETMIDDLKNRVSTLFNGGPKF